MQSGCREAVISVRLLRMKQMTAGQQDAMDPNQAVKTRRAAMRWKIINGMIQPSKRWSRRLPDIWSVY